ncbi:potassium transporter TrkA [Actinoplanes sp. Pm04-4]|jgi:K+/H+ antiporter YhaU regulatory subunit KhtT|uniref:Potassium transporter TrkA n=1 Tax=Paractinoplanes pyxinae TaxID=2997416 RepID=A0ABT4B6I5_9ACTN|nr:potassium transporter TrkA [Actinoplanes pyxinae]MCY1142119.1 potassium transporter TrkA [Actinoplanes pyxinae]
MGKGVRIQELPGLGTRYDVDLHSGSDRVSIVVGRDGKRHLYVFTTAGDEPTAVIELTEEQARKVGAVLAGTFFVD